MSITNKSETAKDVQEEIVSYCDRSSIIGANYFFSHYTTIEKFFWVVAVVIMLIAASFEVNVALTTWNQNPIVTATESINAPISAIQFPTVTICPDFTPDKNGFVRNMLNLLELQCLLEQDMCQENKSNNTNSTLDIVNETYRFGLITSNYNLVLESFTFIDGLFESMKSNPIADSEKAFLARMYVEDFLLNPIWDQLYSVPNDLRSSIQTIPLDLEELLRKKLTGLFNNFDIYQHVSTSKNGLDYEYLTSLLNDNKIMTSWKGSICINDTCQYIDEEPLTNILNARARLIYMVLGWPLPGQFGTIHFNFQKISSNPALWFCDPLSDRDAQFSDYYKNILTGMLNGTEIDVDPSEVSAILNPRPAYFDMEKYPRQFPNTIWALRQNINQNDTRVCSANNAELLTSTFLENYFGKLLGKNLLIIMEIMFHSQLRLVPLKNDRYIRLANIYHGITEMETYLKASLTFLATPFNVTWTDYQGTSSPNPPYFWTASNDFFDIQLKLFENVRNSTSTDDEKANTLEKLQETYQYLQMMSFCNGPGNDTCKERFQPVMTDNGICYAFNTIPFNSTMINNTYLDMFQQIFEPGNYLQSIVNNTQNGKAFQLYMVLDSHQSKIMDNLKGKFSISINNVYGFMNVRDAAIDVQVGYVTKIRLVPMQVTTSEAFKKQDLLTRQCRYIDENTDPFSLFKFYSYSGCIFECRLRVSAKACGCTPWNYPQYGNETITEICDGPQSYCFEQKMDEVNVIACDCLPDCESITYTATSDISLINYYQECYLPKDLPWGMNKQGVDLNVIIGEKIRHMEGEEYLFWYELVQQNTSILPDIVANNKYIRYLDPRMTQDKCIELLQNDFAILTIEVSVPVMTVLNHDMAVDFFTKISNVGGNLGLFTGMGILSFVEIGFLIYRILRVMLERAKY